MHTKNPRNMICSRNTRKKKLTVKPEVPNLPLAELNRLRKREVVCFRENYCWAPDFKDFLESMDSQPDVEWTVRGGDYQTIYCSAQNKCLIKGKAVGGASSATTTFGDIRRTLGNCAAACWTQTTMDWVHCTDQIRDNPHFDVTISHDDGDQCFDFPLGDLHP
ncbi:hypothetical protein TWF696_009453 [Orbilia brochopaga]|uniref:Uncharacterized protein n=1 Tax=Orbilia brochopaga TaxID=3140254 RepID=A0AAV9UC75_9PEZI